MAWGLPWPARRIFRLFWWIVCLCTLVALPLIVWDFDRNDSPLKHEAWFIGGVFVILAVPISVYEVIMHTEYYTRPRLQRHVIRILWMVPIYGLNAWFALRYRDTRVYFDALRECYEAYTIYSFYMYLNNYLEDELGNVAEYLAGKPQAPHMFGMGYLLKPWDMGREFLWECKKGTLNYVILRPILALITFVTTISHKYGGAHISMRSVDIFVSVMTNFSQVWAIYCLAMLYTATHQELLPIRPLSKFICIKAIVFLTFWQYIAIQLLVQWGVIKVGPDSPFQPADDDPTNPYPSPPPAPTNGRLSDQAQQDLTDTIQETLICIEMFIAALGHTYAFPPRDYADPTIPTKSFRENLRDMFDLRDVAVDVQQVMGEHVTRTTHQVTRAGKRAGRAAVRAIHQLPHLITRPGEKRGGGPSEGALITANLLDGADGHSDGEDPSSPQHRELSPISEQQPKTGAAEMDDAPYPFGAHDGHGDSSDEEQSGIKEHRRRLLPTSTNPSS